MKHLFGKHALVAVVAVLAVLCMTWPAQALKTHSGGVGHHLLYSYWTTADYKDTLIAIHDPLGVKKTFGGMNLVTVVVRDMMGGELAMFDICLADGDSWTAGISSSEMEGMSMLTVGNEGECDGEIVQPGVNREGSPDNTPKMGEPMYIKGMGGSIEAYSPWLVELADDRETGDPVTARNNSEPGRLMDTVGPEPEDRQTATEGGTGEVDSDTNAEPNDPQMITGVAFLVDTMMGYASAYNPVALTCHDIGSTDRDGAEADEIEIDEDPLRSCHRDFDLDGTDVRTPAAPDAAEGSRHPKGNLINKLLTGGIHGVVQGDNVVGTAMNTERANLIGRWITAPEIAAETTVMVTFPGAAYEDHPLDMSDSVSLLVFDEMGMGGAPMNIMLDMAVNTCTFMMADGGGTDIMCNGEMVANIDSDRGGFRIYNSLAAAAGVDANNDDDFDDDDDTKPVDGDDTDATDRYMAAMGANLPAIGLVHSHYDVMGMDGMMGSYDHLSSLLHTGEMN